MRIPVKLEILPAYEANTGDTMHLIGGHCREVMAASAELCLATCLTPSALQSHDISRLPAASLHLSSREQVFRVHCLCAAEGCQPGSQFPRPKSQARA